MEKKHLFFDIDGTLTDRATGKIVPSAQLALTKLQEKGHFVAIATGRALYKSLAVMEDMQLSNMVCSGGAGLVVNHQVVRNTPLDLKKAQAIVKQAESLGFGVLVALEDSIKVWAQNDLFREQVGPRKEPTDYTIDETFDIDQVKEIFKIYIAIPPIAEKFLTLKDTLGYLRFVPEYLVFQHDEKYQGIIDMLDYVHGQRKEVVVFGDGLNDLVMFSPEWTSIAMGNGAQQLKEKADYVTAKNTEDGIYKACEKFGWI
jgi:Cof subfamily protein (haloacid dehalogenase superfamily)